MNDPDQPTATTFSDLAGSAQNQAKFFASLLSFLTTYGFDGVDIDWYILQERLRLRKLTSLGNIPVPLIAVDDPPISPITLPSYRI
jgi:hypothetical protein